VFVHHKPHMDWPGLKPEHSTVRGQQVTAMAQLLSHSYSLYVSFLYPNLDFSHESGNCSKQTNNEMAGTEIWPLH
jgi:hypothetical protein